MPSSLIYETDGLPSAPLAKKRPAVEPRASCRRCAGLQASVLRLESRKQRSLRVDVIDCYFFV